MISDGFFSMTMDGKSNLPLQSSKTFLDFPPEESEPYPMDSKGKRIRYIRENILEEDQGQFGNRFGVTNKAVSQWESDTTEPTPKRLAQIARLGGKTIDWLETGRETGGRKVPVLGYVGAGAEIYPVDDHELGASLDEVEVDFDVDPNTVDRKSVV